MTVWGDMPTPERKAAVKQLWTAGRTAKQIAAAFDGCTENAVLGLIHRGKMHRTGKTMAGELTATRAPKPRERADGQQPRPPRLPNMSIITENRPPLPGIEPISILDLPGRAGVRCRFPVLGGYCGAPSGDAMYCAGHHRYVYTPRPTETARPK